MKLVRFADGSYGVRRWTLFGFKYVNLRGAAQYWWGHCSEYFLSDCRATREIALRRYLDLADNGTPEKGHRG